MEKEEKNNQYQNDRNTKIGWKLRRVSTKPIEINKQKKKMKAKQSYFNVKQLLTKKTNKQHK